MDIRKVMLVVDDSKTNRAVLTGIFSDSYQVLEAENGQIALDILEKTPVSVVVLDINMPVMDGYEVLAQMKQKGMLSYVPVVVNSAFGQDENELKALELGASDFIRKPYNNAIVKRRVENVQSVILYETTRSKRQKDLERMERMRFLMERDHLTGIYNRDSFIQKTTELMENTSVEGYHMVSVDIHQFKVINDVFGSKVGDSVLCRLAGAIARIMDREGCVYAREGGDHFMIFYPSDIITPEALLSELERGLSLETMGSYQVRLKVGVYSVGKNPLPVGKMIDASQIALYTKGDSQLGSPNYFNDTMRDQLMDEQELVAQMQQALDEHEFKVFFQPVFDAKLRKPISAEALVRWVSPKKGMIMPGRFIDIFEKNGLITLLDQYVWEEVAKYQKFRNDAGKPFIPISVNVSRVSLYLLDLPTIFKELIHKYDLDPQSIRLEVTETACVDNMEASVKILGQLQELGFVTLMDDFGSGYSSLNSIALLPIDILKLDMSFVQNVCHSYKSQIILADIVALAKRLHMRTISEGVETAEQLQILSGLGCRWVQGYFFSKPLARDQFEELMESSGVGSEG